MYDYLAVQSFEFLFVALFTRNLCIYHQI